MVAHGEVADEAGGREYYLERSSPEFYLYYSMVLYFQNGGSSCYVVSIGDYGSTIGSVPLMYGIEQLMKEQEPTIVIVHDEQEDLNVTPQVKSINAIRYFISEGTLVWGARTLDGNSLDWRYNNVRRTIIMLEQSIKLACKAYVFKVNDAYTWVTIKGMIRKFLTSIWKRGGLAGAVPDDAFSGLTGLGETEMLRS